MISTRKKIVVIADQLIRSIGYNAFSYADIANKLNIKNAAIHYHFSTKADLGKAVIEETREKFNQNTKTWEDLPLIEQVKAFIEMYRKNEKNDCICFMGSLGSDYNSLPDEMRAELQVAHDEITTWLITRFDEGKKTGEFNFDESSVEMSNMITSGLLASLILERVAKADNLEKMCETLIKRIDKNYSYGK